MSATGYQSIEPVLSRKATKYNIPSPARRSDEANRQNPYAVSLYGITKDRYQTQGKWGQYLS